MLNIKMFSAVVDSNIAVNRATDHLSVFFLYDFLCHSTALLSHMFIFLQLLPRLITLEFQFQVIEPEFLIKQILQPAGTPPFLQNLVTSPVHHAELEHEDH